MRSQVTSRFRREQHYKRDLSTAGAPAEQAAAREIVSGANVINYDVERELTCKHECILTVRRGHDKMPPLPQRPDVRILKVQVRTHDKDGVKRFHVFMVTAPRCGQCVSAWRRTLMATAYPSTEKR
jgi:hypothetical protein